MTQIALNLLQANLAHMDSYNGSTDAQQKICGAKASAETEHKSFIFPWHLTQQGPNLT